MPALYIYTIIMYFKNVQSTLSYTYGCIRTNITVKRPLKSPNKVNVMEWYITIKMSEIELYRAISFLEVLR